MKIGLALGGGGARGYAHIPALEALDELGVRPACIAGTSIGAIVGMIYASGVSGAELRREVEEATIWRRHGLRQLTRKRRLAQWMNVLRPEFRQGGFIRSDRIIETIVRELGVSRFEDLGTPLSVVATDLWRCEEVIFSSGPLAPAIRASMAIPGVFAPVSHEDRLLVDGGLVNLVPFSRLDDDCDLTIGIDALGLLPEDRHDVQNAYEVLKRTIDLMQYAGTARRLEVQGPDILLHADVGRFLISDFHRAEAILTRADPIREALKSALAPHLPAIRSGGSPTPEP